MDQGRVTAWKVPNKPKDSRLRTHPVAGGLPFGDLVEDDRERSRLSTAGGEPRALVSQVAARKRADIRSSICS